MQTSDSAITMSQATGVAGWLVAALFALIAFLLKREVSRVEEDHKKLELRVEKEEAKREADDKAHALALETSKKDQALALEVFKKEQLTASAAAVASMQQQVDRAIANLERAVDDVKRSSSTSLNDAEEQIEKLRVELSHRYDQLSDRFTSMREESIRMQGAFGEKFLTRADFIRDSTVLDGKITSTLRTVGKIEGNIDKLLREYTQEG